MLFVVKLLRYSTCVRLLPFVVVSGFFVSLQGATFDVRNTNDDGPASLRQAILDANSNPGIDTITFTFPELGPYTINLSNGLPIITDPVRIDGTTQPGYEGKPI